MYRYIGDYVAYSLINTIAANILLTSSVFLFPLKQKVLGFYTKSITNLVSRANKTAGLIVKFVLASIESLLMAFLLYRSTFANASFGDMVGTGSNYFAVLIIVPFAWFALSLVLMIHPLKQIDIISLLLPVYLFFVKLACFCNGCCWGISWEYGLYNYNTNTNNPGKQVPVQALEMFFALAIFIFLLFYRKKAKTGTIYPMYVILYCVTRFPVEFLSAAHPAVWGPFNMYHILCAIGFVVGLISFFIVRKYSDKLSDFCEIPQKAPEAIITKIKEKKAQKIADEEAERLARLEKAKLARAKAKARKK